MWIIPPTGLIEPVTAPVIWVDGIGAIDVSNNVLTTYYYAAKPSLCGKEVDHVLEIVIKRPVEALAPQIMQMMQALSPPIPPPAAPNLVSVKLVR
jgi:hypothetical protein